MKPPEQPDSRDVDGVLLKTPSEAPTMDLPRASGGDALTRPIPSTARSPIEEPPPIPSRLGSYRIIGPIGGGGMGEVYEAFDESLERPAAVKVIARRYSCDSAMFERLQIEARAAARLNHPNIVTVFQLGLEGDVAYIAMERITGESLAGVIRVKGRLPVQEALNIVRQAAAGLAHAADNKVIHRDIKPSNLMVLPDGSVKVLDFGLAKRLESSDPSLTDTNCRIGTPLYMAPEQSLGEQVDMRADIYALGVTLYNAIVGRPPFEASSPVAAAVKHATTPIEYPDDLRRVLGGRVAELIEWMTAKDVSRRTPNYAALLERLDLLIRELGSNTPVRQQSRLRARFSVIAIVGALVVLALGLIANRHQKQSSLRAAQQETVMNVVVEPEATLSSGGAKRPPRLGERLRNLNDSTANLPARESMRSLSRTLKEREVLADLCLEGDLTTALRKLRETQADGAARRPMVERMAIADLLGALTIARDYQKSQPADATQKQLTEGALTDASSEDEGRAHRAVVYLLAVAPESGQRAWTVFGEHHPKAAARADVRGPVMLLSFLHNGPLD